MINIVIFDPAETPGGAFSRAVELAAELPEFNYLFLTYKPFTELHSGACPPHYKMVRLFSFINPTQAHWLHKKSTQHFSSKIIVNFLDFIVRAMLKTNKILLQIQTRFFFSGHQIDLVQANNGIHFIPFYLSEIKKAKLIYYFRDLQYFAHLPQHLLQKGEKLIFVGQKLFEQYQTQLNLPKNRCQVIHSPFDVYNRIKFEPQQNLELLQHLKKSGNKIIACCGRICAEKGQHIIIEAINLLAKSWPDLTLIIIGDAANTIQDQHYLTSLKLKVKEYQLEEKVFFLGHRKNPLHILQYADIAVQAPTYFEALAGSLVEALQLGIPTISANIGGASEVLKEGETGFLFPPEDYRALADMADQILRDATAITPIIERGKTHALQNWSPKKISAQMYEIYSAARIPS